ncbi:XkdF-like putative serine protease domain-containing protein [Gracilibacillus sp. D59]|uniref:XkdF-like putative serine protease domain-containing protein n=1 Tax=Gracilibacillus sp. D59 TaxID=3457434 RepID=UPI003FCDBD6E
MAELTAPLVRKNDEKRIVYGPVLVPDEPDSDDDTVTAEKIEEVAHQFVENYGNIDLMHSLENVGKMVESYILPMDMEIDDNLTVPKGSWMLGVRVTNDDSWEAVKNHQLGGFSIMAIPKVSTKSKENAEKNHAEKRTTIADLEQEGDWVVNAVSLVDEPAVPKAKYVAVKSKAKKDQSHITEEAVQKAIQGSLEERERLVRRKVYSEFDTETTESFVHSTMQDSVIIKIINYLNDHQKMYQLGYEIDESGNVLFTSDLQEVRIEEQIVPVDNSGTNFAQLSKEGEGNTNDSAIKDSNIDSNSESNSFLDKIKKRLGIKSSTEKAGRSISQSNLEKLLIAKEVIDDLLSVGQAERSNSNKSESGEDEMREEQVQSMIQKSVEPLQDQIKELTNTLKGENQEESTDKQGAEQTEEGQPSEKSKEGTEEQEGQQEEGTEETVSKSEHEKLLAELEKAKKQQPLSRRLSGQDNLESVKEKEPEKDRNAFGYKRK